MTANEAGKGSDRRPCLVSRRQYAENWDRAFRRHPDCAIRKTCTKVCKGCKPVRVTSKLFDETMKRHGIE
jgi:hypothetical protein